MPSPCNRCIQSATRSGNSRSTSAQSPTGASSGRGRQIRWTLVARAAESRARILADRSVAMGQEPVIVHPPRIIPDNRASQPSVVLWANTTEPAPSSFRTLRPSAKAYDIVCSNHSRFLGRPLTCLVSSCTISRILGDSELSGSKLSRNSGLSGSARFSQTKKKSERSA